MKKMILCIISGLLINFCVSAGQTTGAPLEDESAVKHESTQPTTNNLQPSLKGTAGASLYALQKLLLSSQELPPDYYIPALAISDYLSWYFSLNLGQTFAKDRSDLIISTYELIKKLHPYDPSSEAEDMSQLYHDGIIKEADAVGTKFPPWSVNDEK